jgi:hypothetical protein
MNAFSHSERLNAFIHLFVIARSMAIYYLLIVLKDVQETIGKDTTTMRVIQNERVPD